MKGEIMNESLRESEKLLLDAARKSGIKVLATYPDLLFGNLIELKVCYEERTCVLSMELDEYFKDPVDAWKQFLRMAAAAFREKYDIELPQPELEQTKKAGE